MFRDLKPNISHVTSNDNFQTYEQIGHFSKREESSLLQVSSYITEDFAKETGGKSKSYGTRLKNIDKKGNIQ